MRLQLKDHFDDWIKKGLPPYVSLEDLRASSVEIIYGLLASPSDVVPEAAPYLGELLMWMFLHQPRSDYERCVSKTSCHQILQLLQGLDDEKLTGRKVHAWVKSMIIPCTSMNELMETVQKYTNDTNVATMSVIAAVVFPAGVHHLRSALIQETHLQGHVPILLRSMEHMPWMNDRRYITHVDVMLRKYAEWVKRFKECKKRKCRGGLHLRRADHVWQNEVDEKPPAKKRSYAENNANDLCYMIDAKRQMLVDMMHTLAITCDATGDEVSASQAKDAMLDINIAVDGVLSQAHVGKPRQCM